MGSALGSTLANMFLCQFEEQLMYDCSFDYEPISYRRYVEDSVLLFSSELHVTKFLNYMNFKLRNICHPASKKKNK